AGTAQKSKSNWTIREVDLQNAHSFESGFPDPKSAVDQWCIDFSQPDGGAGPQFLQRQELTVSAPKKAELIDVVGTYHPRVLPGTAPPQPKANWRLCIVVLQVPSGPLYFRMVGPNDAVWAERDKLKHMIQTAQ